MKKVAVTKIKTLLVSLALVFVGAVSADHLGSEHVKERTQPAGKVYRVGDDVPVAKPMVVESSGPRGGSDVYNTKCAMCHSAGIAGAPVVGDAAQWTARIAQGEAALFDHAINGLNGMPPKGGCTDCSDDEIKEAVKHMVGQSQ